LGSVKSSLKLKKLIPRQRLGNGNILNNSRLITLCLKGKKGHWLSRIRRQLLHQFNLKPIRTPRLTGNNTDTATNSAKKEGDVKGERNAVFILAGNTIVVEESLFAELSNGLDAVGGGKEVVEEEGVLSGEEKMANLSHFVQGRQESPVQQTYAIVSHKCLELHISLSILFLCVCVCVL
jgi:hypothetical protein